MAMIPISDKDHIEFQKPPIWQIEFIGDGNAIVRRTDKSEELIPAGLVADVLQQEYKSE